MDNYLLLTAIFVPLATAFILFLGHRVFAEREALVRGMAVLAQGYVLAVSIFVFANFSPDNLDPGAQFRFSKSWISAIHSAFILGIDGLNAVLFFLAAFIFILATLSSNRNLKGTVGYFSMLLLLETALCGALLSMDLLQFVAFFSISIVPAYFLLTVWPRAGSDRVQVDSATSSFFGLNFLSALLLTGGVLLVNFGAKPVSLALADIAKATLGDTRLEIFGRSLGIEGVCYALMSGAFFIRIGILPFHGWMRNLGQIASAPVLAIVASVFRMVGGYGFIRINFLIFPNALQKFSWVVSVLSIISVIYCSLLLIGQKNLRQAVGDLALIGSAIALFGFSFIDPVAFGGGVLAVQGSMLAVAAAFLLLGALEDRTESSPAQQNINYRTAWLSALLFVALLSMAMIPGLPGFNSMSMVLLGAFPFSHGRAVWVAIGLLLVSIGILRSLAEVLKKLMIDRVSDDLTVREIFVHLPIGVVLLSMGLFPNVILGAQSTFLGRVIELLQGVR